MNPLVGWVIYRAGRILRYSPDMTNHDFFVKMGWR